MNHAGAVGCLLPCHLVGRSPGSSRTVVPVPYGHHMLTYYRDTSSGLSRSSGSPDLQTGHENLKGVKEEVKTKLHVRAEAARKAPDELLDAMVEAAEDGATNLDIAKEIGFFYNPDYIGKLITKRVGPRKPGRRPRRD